MSASDKAVAAVMEVLSCERHDYDGIMFRDEPCVEHLKPWTDRGCPVAVDAADAAVDAYMEAVESGEQP